MFANILPADVVPATLADDGRRLQLLGIPSDVAPHLTEYVHRLNVAQGASLQRQYDSLWRRVVDAGSLAAYEYFDVDPAATSAGKYLRVVTMRPSRSADTLVSVPSSVHAFVVKATGELVKPAGWQGPAKSTSKARRGQLLSRYNLADDTSRAVLFARMEADPASIVHGGYLYQS